MSLTKIGMYVWGTVTVVLAAASFVFVIGVGFIIGGDGHFAADTPRPIPGMYATLRDNGQLVAAILAVSGLAWSYFYNQVPVRTTGDDLTGCPQIRRRSSSDAESPAARDQIHPSHKI